MKLKFFMVLFISFLLGCQKQNISGEKENIVLNFKSWRVEDSSRMDYINSFFTKKYPYISIKYNPVKSVDYDESLDNEIKMGLSSDIVLLRSYDKGYRIYNKGVLLELNKDIVKLKEYPQTAKNAWTTQSGIQYGLPIAGVLHGIYFRKSVFEQYNLEPPKTWDEFIDLCEFLYKKGITPISQGTVSEWTLYEVLFSGLGPNFYGGEETRQELLKKEIRITDKKFVKTLNTLVELKKYFPLNNKDLDYNGMLENFKNKDSAMFIGGSWEISIFKEMGVFDDIGYFAPPVENLGDNLQYNFHVDMGVGINKNSENLEEALLYVNWMATDEFAQLFMNELPGFFSFTPGIYSLDNELSKKMYSYLHGSDKTVRTLWEGFSAQEPSGNSLMSTALKKLYNNEVSVLEALDYVNSGLSWYY